MFGDRDVHRLIGEIYDAAVDANLWNDFLNDLLSHMPPESKAALLLYDMSSGSSVICNTWDEHYGGSYLEHYQNVNPWLPNFSRVQVGVPYTGSALVAPGDMVKTEFYNDWLKPQGIVASGGPSIMLAQETTRMMALTVLSTRDVPDDDASFRLLALLRPHLRRAAQIHRQFRLMEYRRGALEETLDRLAVGAILVEPSGKVVFANRKAQRLFERGDGLGADGGGHLRAGNAGLNAELRRLIRSANLTSLGAGGESGGVMAIPRGERLPLSLLVAPLGSAVAETGEATVAIFVRDPEDCASPHPGHLARLFNLTPAEAKLLAALAEGRTLEDCANAFAVSIHTIRTHLKALFAKTGCQRQTELVRLALTVCGPGGYSDEKGRPSRWCPRPGLG